MLTHLLETPRTKEDWAIFSWSHRDAHKQIIQAIQGKGGGALIEYVLDPIDLTQFPEFLAANQQAHNAFNGVLGTQGSDLSQLDLNDPEQVKAWAFLHYEEHFTAAAILGLG